MFGEIMLLTKETITFSQNNRNLLFPHFDNFQVNTKLNVTQHNRAYNYEVNKTIN